jgi:membrane protein
MPGVQPGSSTGTSHTVSTPSRAGWPGRLRSLGAEVRAQLHGHDVLLAAAGLTFYAAVAALPLVLVSIRLVALLLGERRVDAIGAELTGMLPDRLGASSVGRDLVRAGAHLPWLAALASLVPASLYGEGLRRAYSRLSPRSPTPGAVDAWRSRLLTLVLLAVLPLMLLVAVLVTSAIAWIRSGGLWQHALGAYLAFDTAWVVVSVPLAVGYRVFAPERPRLRALVWGAGATGSMIAGFLVGFVIFLGLPIDIGAAYGGFRAFARLVAVGGWLLVLHVIALVGYALTLRLDARGGRPLGQTPKVDRGYAAAGSVTTLTK